MKKWLYRCVSCGVIYYDAPLDDTCVMIKSTFDHEDGWSSAPCSGTVEPFRISGDFSGEAGKSE